MWLEDLIGKKIKEIRTEEQRIEIITEDGVLHLFSDKEILYFTKSTERGFLNKIEKELEDELQ